MNESGSILFVDDRIDTILAIRDSLHFSGYQVFTATTHDQAVQIVKHDSIQLAIRVLC